MAHQPPAGHSSGNRRLVQPCVPLQQQQFYAASRGTSCCRSGCARQGCCMALNNVRDSRATTQQVVPSEDPRDTLQDNWTEDPSFPDYQRSQYVEIESSVQRAADPPPQKLDDMVADDDSRNDDVPHPHELEEASAARERQQQDGGVAAPRQDYGTEPSPTTAAERSPAIENLAEFIANRDGVRVVANDDKDIEEQIRQLRSLQEILDQSISRLTYALNQRRGRGSPAADDQLQQHDEDDNEGERKALLNDGVTCPRHANTGSVNVKNNVFRANDYIARLRERKRKRSASRKSEEETGEENEGGERVAKKRAPNERNFGASQAFLFGFGGEAKANPAEQFKLSRADVMAILEIMDAGMHEVSNRAYTMVDDLVDMANTGVEEVVNMAQGGVIEVVHMAQNGMGEIMTMAQKGVHDVVDKVDGGIKEVVRTAKASLQNAPDVAGKQKAGGHAGQQQPAAAGYAGPRYRMLSDEGTSVEESGTSELKREKEHDRRRRTKSKESKSDERGRPASRGSSSEDFQRAPGHLPVRSSSRKKKKRSRSHKDDTGIRYESGSTTAPARGLYDEQYGVYRRVRPTDEDPRSAEQSGTSPLHQHAIRGRHVTLIREALGNRDDGYGVYHREDDVSDDDEDLYAPDDEFQTSYRACPALHNNANLRSHDVNRSPAPASVQCSQHTRHCRKQRCGYTNSETMTVNNNNLDNRSLEEVRRQLKAALHANLLTVAARGSLAAGQLDNCEALLRENVEQARRRELSERDGGGAEDQTMYEYSDELGDVEPRQVCVTRDSTRGNRSEAGASNTITIQETNDADFLRQRVAQRLNMAKGCSVCQSDSATSTNDSSGSLSSSTPSLSKKARTLGWISSLARKLPGASFFTKSAAGNNKNGQQQADKSTVDGSGDATQGQEDKTEEVKRTESSESYGFCGGDCEDHQTRTESDPVVRSKGDTNKGNGVAVSRANSALPVMLREMWTEVSEVLRNFLNVLGAMTATWSNDSNKTSEDQVFLDTLRTIHAAVDKMISMTNATIETEATKKASPDFEGNIKLARAALNLVLNILGPFLLRLVEKSVADRASNLEESVKMKTMCEELLKTLHRSAYLGPSQHDTSRHGHHQHRTFSSANKSQLVTDVRPIGHCVQHVHHSNTHLAKHCHHRLLSNHHRAHQRVLGSEDDFGGMTSRGSNGTSIVDESASVPLARKLPSSSSRLKRSLTWSNKIPALKPLSRGATPGGGEKAANSDCCLLDDVANLRPLKRFRACESLHHLDGAARPAKPRVKWGLCQIPLTNPLATSVPKLPQDDQGDGDQGSHDVEANPQPGTTAEGSETNVLLPPQSLPEELAGDLTVCASEQRALLEDIKMTCSSRSPCLLLVPDASQVAEEKFSDEDLRAVMTSADDINCCPAAGNMVDVATQFHPDDGLIVADSGLNDASEAALSTRGNVGQLEPYENVPMEATLDDLNDLYRQQVDLTQSSIPSRPAAARPSSDSVVESCFDDHHDPCDSNVMQDD